MLGTHEACAVVSDDQPVNSPVAELSYKDFCEALVRIAHARYPLLPTLERQVQQLISQHLLPMGGSPAKGASRLTTPAVAAAPAAMQAADNAAGEGRSVIESLLGHEVVVRYLRSQHQHLRRLFAYVLSDSISKSSSSGGKHDLSAVQVQSVNAAAAGHAPSTTGHSPRRTRNSITSCADSAITGVSTLGTAEGRQHHDDEDHHDLCHDQHISDHEELPDTSCVTVQQMLCVMQECGVCQSPLTVSAAAVALLEGFMATKDPQAQR